MQPTDPKNAHQSLILAHEPHPFLQNSETAAVTPASVTASRMASNLDVFGFDLDACQVAALDALDRDGRAGPFPGTLNGWVSVQPINNIWPVAGLRRQSR